MSRTHRVLELIAALRAYRSPVTASQLALELGVSLRTVYRDIETLRGLGAPVDGQAGVGFRLREGFFLPEFAFSPDELEALVLGLGWVRQRGDPVLARAGDAAVAKILSASGGSPARDEPFGLITADPRSQRTDPPHAAQLRSAIRRQRKLAIGYENAEGAKSERVVWPIAIVYFDEVRVLAAWCEQRAGFRHFRVDRLRVSSILEDRYPGRRHMLMAQWRRQDRDWRSILPVSDTASR